MSEFRSSGSVCCLKGTSREEEAASLRLEGRDRVRQRGPLSSSPHSLLAPQKKYYVGSSSRGCTWDLLLKAPNCSHTHTHACARTRRHTRAHTCMCTCPMPGLAPFYLAGNQ